MSNAEERSVHIHVERDHAEIRIHTPKEKINKLDRKAFQELYEHIGFLKAKAEIIKTVLIYSDKPEMFLAGADINEIRAMTEKSQALDLVQQAQEVFQALAELPQVTLVAIDGPCMGGGCELALACTYRLISDSKSSMIGLPEVQIGVLPGAGGTQRLPKLVGLQNALGMILKSSRMDGKKALKIGLVDDVIPKERLLEVARKVLKDRSYTKYERPSHFMESLIVSTPLKKLMFKMARKSVLKESGGHYPAPLMALSVVERTLGMADIREGLKIEADGFAELAIGQVAKNCINLFFASEELKKDRGVHAGEAIGFKPGKVQSIAVLGAGVMGGGIAAVASQKSISVRLKDVNHESIQNGLKTARSLFDKELKRKKVDLSEFRKRLYRISPTLQFTGFEHLNFVIEAVVEKMEIKKSVIAELDKILPENAIIASNTSSLSISEMAKASRRPGQFVGMHFFNPVPKMPLVEVVRGDQTSPETVIQTVAFGRQLGKTVIVVKDRPGFLINRILMPFLLECAHLREEGFSIAQIDHAALKFGMPMGPFRLMDEIGLDTGAKVARSIASGFPHMIVLPAIYEMVKQNYLGKKNGRGFYVYNEAGKHVAVRKEFSSLPKNPGAETDSYLQDRLILPMVTEAVMALDEGIVAAVRDLDLGLIYGIGFPPFRGGLLKWVSDVGERQILDRLNNVHNLTKGRILVPASLTSRVQAQQKFYS